ncbi:GAF and ANTAR domain-containing protein [Microlunatus lacustris]
MGVFAELGRIVHATDGSSLSPVLQRVADLAQQLIPELAEVSVTLVEHGRARTVVFTGRLAVVLDERQYASGFGPCLDAAASGSTIAVDTAVSDNPYPDFSQAAAAQGITRVLAVGLPIAQRTLGALNMFSDAEHPFSPDSVALAETFASYAGIAVANATLYHAAVDEAQHMHAALRSRAVIEQAKGVLMTTRHCTADEAFALLTRASQHQNRKLHDIATELVARTTRPPEEGRRTPPTS